MNQATVHSDGSFILGGKTYRCALGRAGVFRNKKEGDGATPAGNFPIREVLYRPDRVTVDTALPAQILSPEDGWCDDPADPAYNRKVRLPHAAHTEALWRDDHIYDVVVVLGHNDDPPIPGNGSAIFMHVARDGYTPTDGCIALALPDLLEVLSFLSPHDHVCVCP